MFTISDVHPIYSQEDSRYTLSNAMFVLPPFPIVCAPLSNKGKLYIFLVRPYLFGLQLCKQIFHACFLSFRFSGIFFVWSVLIV